MLRLRNWCFTYNVPENYAENRPSRQESNSPIRVPARVPPARSSGVPSELPRSPSDRRDEDNGERRRSHISYIDTIPYIDSPQSAISPRSDGEDEAVPCEPDDDGREPLERVTDFSSFISLEGNLRFAIWQLESAPSTGRLHLQGYLEFEVSMRLSSVKRFLSAESCHLEGRRGTRDQAIAYCRKEESHVAGPWEVGRAHLRPGKRTDIDEVTDLILSGKPLLELVAEYPVQFVRNHRGFEYVSRSLAFQRQVPWRDVKVMVYWGESGTGKTRLAFADAGNDIYSLPQGERIWFDGYIGQTHLLLDDYYGWIKYGLFLKLLDGYPVPCPVKGGFVPNLWTTVIITSNKPPAEWYSFGLTDALKRRLATGETKHFSSLVN